jgi:hypothetical protein
MRASAALRASVAPGGVLAGPWVRNELWRRARMMPSLDLPFADYKSLTNLVSGGNLITFTRAYESIFTGPDGLLKTAGNGVPVFDHDPITRACLGLRSEEQRINRLLHNRDLTQAAWVATNITPAKDQIGADGVSNSASSITSTAGNGTILQTITSASAARATSAYVKRITGSGAVEMTQNGGTTWTAVTVTGDWTRVQIPSATVTNPVVGFRIVASGDAIAVDYVQCEDGTVITSPIATGAATATRSADVASITGTNFSSWYRQDEGTMFVQASPNVLKVSGAQYQAGTGTSGVNEVRIRFVDSFAAAQIHSSAGETFAYLRSATANANYATALAYKSNDSAAAINSVLSATDTSVTLPTTASTMYVGMDAASSSQLNGTIRRLTYWPHRLPNYLLQELTR